MIAVAAGFNETIASKADGSAWAWGGWPMGPVRPQPAPLVASATGVTARGCFVSGQVYHCPFETVPDGTLQVDVAVDFAPAAYPSYCIVDAAHTLSCTFGTAAPPTLVVATDIAQVAVGWDHLCAIRLDGSVFCQYHDPSGDGSPELWPGDLPSLGTDTVMLASSGQGACALRGDGTVWCWGHAYHGETAGAQGPTPTKIEAAGSDVTSIAMGSEATCALKKDGSLWCWGGTGAGAMIDFAPPTPVAGLPPPVTAFSVGQLHSCAVAAQEQLFCWGANDNGELGNGDAGLAVGLLPLPRVNPPVPSAVLGCP